MHALKAETRMRVGGSWLAIGALLLAGALIFHGPPAADTGAQMNAIAEAPTRWALVHWVAATALFLFAVAGLVILAAPSRLTRNGWTVSAWAVLVVGALWTATTAVAEATAVTGAARSGNLAMFEAWWAFSGGMATGFTLLALAMAGVAGSEARADHAVTPRWASWTGAAAGAASFTGWALGMWLGVEAGNLVWVISTLVMCLWILWFGVSLVRANDVPAGHIAVEPGG
jgi:hypothetical protein